MRMLSRLIEAGNKIEMQAVEHVRTADNVNKVHRSEVYEVLSEDRLEVTMPIEKAKIILLQVDDEYDMVFYTPAGLYQCFGRIIDRYKSNNVYLLLVELTSNLRKYQRRDYYRYACALAMGVRPLEEEEVEAAKQGASYYKNQEAALKNSVIVDISGGGLRFMSEQKYEAESLLYCTFKLLTGGKEKCCETSAKVLSVKESEKRPGTYEHRVQYINMDVGDREEIIKYIFEEERKARRKEWDKK